MNGSERGTRITRARTTRCGAATAPRGQACHRSRGPASVSGLGLVAHRHAAIRGTGVSWQVWCCRLCRFNAVVKDPTPPVKFFQGVTVVDHERPACYGGHVHIKRDRRGRSVPITLAPNRSRSTTSFQTRPVTTITIPKPPATASGWPDPDRSPQGHGSTVVLVGHNRSSNQSSSHAMKKLKIRLQPPRPQHCRRSTKDSAGTYPAVTAG